MYHQRHDAQAKPPLNLKWASLSDKLHHKQKTSTCIALWSNHNGPFQNSLSLSRYHDLHTGQPGCGTRGGSSQHHVYLHYKHSQNSCQSPMHFCTACQQAGPSHAGSGNGHYHCTCWGILCDDTPRQCNQVNKYTFQFFDCKHHG